MDGDSIVYKRDINLGIAVALCRAIQDLASRARGKKLNPEDTAGLDHRNP